MSINKSILSGIAKDCNNMSASIGAEKDLILVNYLDFDKVATLSPFNRQLNDDFGNKGGITDIFLKAGAQTYVFEGTDYSVIPSVTTEVKEDGNTWFSHSIAFTAYNKTMEARATLLSLGKARVIAVTRDRSTGLFELFGAEQGLKLSGLDRAYTGAQNSNFYSVTISTPEIAVIREKSIAELSLKLNGQSGGGSIPPDQNNLEYLLSLKEDKVNKGQANGYAPLDGSAKVPASNLNIVNDLTSGGVSALLSAEQGKILNNRLNAGLNNVKSERIITISTPVNRTTASIAINALPAFTVTEDEIPYFVTTVTEGEQGYRVELIGLGRGTYGQGGSLVVPSNVRVSSLINSSTTMGINEVLSVNNVSFDKEQHFRNTLNSSGTKIDSLGFNISNMGKGVRILEQTFDFIDTTKYGIVSLLPPTRLLNQSTQNRLPNKSGFLTVSVNGVFADANGNINISGGGAVPTWQQTLDQATPDVIVPSMTVNLTGGATGLQIQPAGTNAFSFYTDRVIDFSSSNNGNVSIGGTNGVLIQGQNKPIKLITDQNQPLTLDAGAWGVVEMKQTTGVLISGRTVGVTIEGNNSGIVLNGGVRTTITGSALNLEAPTFLKNVMTVDRTQIKFMDSNAGTTLVSQVQSTMFNESGSLTSAVQLSGKTRINDSLYLTNDVKFFKDKTLTSESICANISQTGVTTNHLIKLPTGVKGDFVIATNVNGVFADVDGTITIPTGDTELDINEVLGFGSISTDKTQKFKATGVVSETLLSHNSISITDGVKSFVTGAEKASFQNDTSHFMGEFGTAGIVLNQNPLNPNFKTTLLADKNVDTDKVISLPNANGTLIMTINGLPADENGNIVVSSGGTNDLQAVLNAGTFATFDGGQNTIQLMDGEGKEINFITSITADESYSQFQQTTDQILLKNGVGTGNDEGSFSIIGANPVLERRVDLGGGQTGVIQLMFDGDTTEGTKLYSLPNDKVAKPFGIPYVLATLDDISAGGNQNLQDVIDKGSVMQKTNGSNYFSMAFTHTPSNDVITSIDQYWEDVDENSFRSLFQQFNGKLGLTQQEDSKSSLLRFKSGFDGSNTIYEIPTKPNRFELDGTTPIPYILATMDDITGGGSQTLQQTLNTGSTGEVTTDISLAKTGKGEIKIADDGISVSSNIGGNFDFGSHGSIVVNSSQGFSFDGRNSFMSFNAGQGLSFTGANGTGLSFESGSLTLEGGGNDVNINAGGTNTVVKITANRGIYSTTNVIAESSIESNLFRNFQEDILNPVPTDMNVQSSQRFNVSAKDAINLNGFEGNTSIGGYTFNDGTNDVYGLTFRSNDNMTFSAKKFSYNSVDVDYGESGGKVMFESEPTGETQIYGMSHDGLPKMLELPSGTFDMILGVDAFGDDLVGKVFDKTTLTNTDSSIPSSKAVKDYVDAKTNEAVQVKVNYTGLTTSNFSANTPKTLDINSATPTLVGSPTTTFPKSTPHTYTGFFDSARGTTPTGRLIENPISGQKHVWRFQVSYSNKASGNNGSLDLTLRNPVSGFVYTMPFTLPSGRTSGTFNNVAITIADNVSIPSPEGYILTAETSFADANLTVEILSITRFSESVEIH